MRSEKAGELGLDPPDPSHIQSLCHPLEHTFGRRLDGWHPRFRHHDARSQYKGPFRRRARGLPTVQNRRHRPVLSARGCGKIDCSIYGSRDAMHHLYHVERVFGLHKVLVWGCRRNIGDSRARRLPERRLQFELERKRSPPCNRAGHSRNSFPTLDLLANIPLNRE